MILKVGDVAPDFTLTTDTGEQVTLSKIQGKKLLYFYPKDDTPGCTKEACDFRDSYPRFQQEKVHIFGVSKDSQVKHAKFKQKYSLPFTLLVDENGDVCQDYGVLDKKSLFGKTFLGIKRSTFLLDEKNVVQAIWRNVKVSGHIEQVLNELE